MRNHRCDIHARLNESNHLIPRLIHLTAVDALEMKPLKDNFIPVDRRGARDTSQEGDASAASHIL